MTHNKLTTFILLATVVLFTGCESNQPPNVQVGPAQTVNVGDKVRLRGSASDPDGAIAVAILHKRYVEGDPEMEALLKTERIHAEVAAQLYQIRIESGLSQRELAKKVGTSASVICRLENADYEGHSLAMQHGWGW